MKSKKYLVLISLAGVFITSVSCLQESRNDDELTKLLAFPIERELEIRSSEGVGCADLSSHRTLVRMAYSLSHSDSVDQFLKKFEGSLLSDLHDLFLSQNGIKKVIGKTESVETLAAEVIQCIGIEFRDADDLLIKLKEKSKEHNLIFHKKNYDHPAFKTFLSVSISKVPKSKELKGIQTFRERIK